MGADEVRGVRRGPKIAAVGLLLVIGLMGVLWAALVRGQTAGRGGLAINATGRAGQVRVRPAPNFELRLFEGGIFRLVDQRGKLVLVNFWASWCPPCREEAPELEAAWRALGPVGTVFVGINVWESEESARAFLRAYGISYPNGPDPRGRILVDFGVTGIPETYVVDGTGRLVQRWVGPITRKELVGLLERVRRSIP
ncbi:MAG: TlpA family protein disulfide reductase [bacterium]